MTMKLDLFTWPPLIAIFLNITLALLALKQNPRSRLHRLFALWNFCVAVWNVGALIMQTAPSAEAALHSGLYIPGLLPSHIGIH